MSIFAMATDLLPYKHPNWLTSQLSAYLLAGVLVPLCFLATLVTENEPYNGLGLTVR